MLKLFTQHAAPVRAELIAVGVIACLAASSIGRNLTTASSDTGP
jgi:hypothetical protein